MSAVLAALFPDHPTAEHVRVRLIKDGFPTDRVELTSRQDLGPAKLVPKDQTSEKLKAHFLQLFPREEDARAVRFLSSAVMGGRAVIAVQPRGDVETRRAMEILEQADPMDLRETDLENQTLERAASPEDRTIVPGVRKILFGPIQPD
jgi:hypothetical protein